MKTATQPRDERGQGLISIIVLSSIGIMLITGFAGWAAINLKAVKQTKQRELALLIAESGVEYYRWHLAHSPSDFKDGTGAAGPYVHAYYDKFGNVIGSFTLNITPPANGSTIVVVKSTGKVTENTNIRRYIEMTLAKPTFAKYAVVANDEMRFGAGTEVFGPIHSNDGIHFDGLAHGLVTSAVSSYNDSDHSGGLEFGVHTHVIPVDPLPGAAVPVRTDVFEAGRQFPVASIDFDGISADFAQIKADATSAGRYHAPSGYLGYHIVLKTNDTYDLYRVTSTVSIHPSCESQGQSGWGSWTINTETLLANYAFPSNGLIFVEDNVWVDGQINTARLNISAARFPENPSNWRSITVNRDLLYTNYDGQDVIALIGQGDFNVGWGSEDDLRIDAAVLAQNGRVGRHYYESPGNGQNKCGPNQIRSTLTLYGMIGTNDRYGFAFTDGTGYQERNIIYDAHLMFSPPPSFPLTADQYALFNWREVRQ